MTSSAWLDVKYFKIKVEDIDFRVYYLPWHVAINTYNKTVYKKQSEP